MKAVSGSWADRTIRWITAVSVVALAAIAAVISYHHVYKLVRRYGETSWTAALLPVSVDGMIAVASMSLLADSRRAEAEGFCLGRCWCWAVPRVWLPMSLSGSRRWWGRLIAAWPSCALIGSNESLCRPTPNAGINGSAISHRSSGTSRRSGGFLWTHLPAPSSRQRRQLALTKLG